jgi:site-specific DNA recombinase
MRAALYVRVSTERQSEEGYSIDFQQERLKAYCTAVDLIVADTFIDPGYSGSNINRPALQNLIERIRDFDIVVVYKLDRLSRSQKDTLHLIEDIFLPNNVNFVSISESFDTSTPFGRAMVGILSVFSQLERENIKERMLSGRVQRAREGLHNGQRNTPIGYRYIDGKLIVDEYEKKQLLDSVDLYLNGYGAQRRKEEMRRRGYKTTYGEWGRSTLDEVLFNPVYRGIVTFNGVEYPGQHERIISDDLFVKILEQKVLRDRGSAFKREHLLSGLLWCEHCGGRIAAKNIHGKHYYACYSATKSTKHMVRDANCPLPRFVMSKLEDDVFSRIMYIYSNTEKYINEHKETYENNNVEVFEKRIDTLNKQIKRLMDLYQFGEIEAREVRERVEALQQEKIGIQKNIDTVVHYDYEGFRDSIKALGEEWNDLSNAEKREYLMGVIDKIVLNKNGEMSIRVKINVAI